MVIVRDGVCGREAALGEPALPLDDGGCRFVGEIVTAHGVAALPASVGRFGGAAEEVGAVRGVAYPLAADVDGVNAQRHLLAGAWELELCDQLCDAAVLPAGEQLDGLVVLERLDRAVEPNRDVLGIHDAP